MAKKTTKKAGSKKIRRRKTTASSATAKPVQPEVTTAGDADERRQKQAEAMEERQAKRKRRKIVRLDNRKLTKKQKGQLAKWKGKNHGNAVDTYLRGQIESARKKTGHHSVMAAGEADNMVIGIPCPALSYEYLIAQDCQPLGLVTTLVGPTMSHKTSLLCEIYRWFQEAGGFAIHEEAETKHSPDLMPSIMGADPRVILERCDSVEDWQRKLTYWIKTQKKDLIGTKENPGPGRTIPIAFGVDSIMGKAAEETQEKVLEDGHAGRGFPVEALSITKYMRTIPKELDEWPFALFLVNHLKMGQDSSGNAERQMAGGKGVGFQESWEIECKVRNRSITCTEWDGVVVELRCHKNSFGPTYRSITTRMLWWEEEDMETGDIVQRTVWDWDWATIRLLTTLKGRPAAKLKANGFHLAAPKTSMVENLAWSRNLGMKAEDAVDWSTCGRMLRENHEVMEILRQSLGIKRRPLLHGDYLHQVESLREEMP